MTQPAAQSPQPVPASVLAYVAGLAMAAVLVGADLARRPGPSDAAWWALPVLVVLLVAATWFVIPFRYGRSLDAVNLLEAALVPLFVGFPPLVVVAAAAGSQLVNGALRRLPWIKTAHNTAMWALAAGLGALIVATVGAQLPTLQGVLTLVAALAVIGVVNNLSVAVVLTLAEASPRTRISEDFVALLRPTWLGAWGANVAFGLLFGFAYLTSPLAAMLFFVPLLVGHLAFRAYIAARADQARLVAGHAAAGRLAEPLDPLTGVEDFLLEVASCFGAAAAELVLRADGGGRTIHHVERGGHYTTTAEGEHVASLAGAIAASPGAVRISADGPDALSRLLSDKGASDCLAAPLLSDGRLSGAILVFDRGGFDGSQEGELTVIEALAREAAGALAKGRLLGEVVAERRKLSQIIDAASDGILTLAPDGTVLSWNPALERMTGLHAGDVVGRRDAPTLLQLRTSDDRRVELSQRALATLPADLFITTEAGVTRHLNCSFSGPGHDRPAVVVARDVTPADERLALREEVTRLVEAEALRRTVVEQLQQAVVPPPLLVDGCELAVAYEASDPSEPTGGDLYDWQVLPSGEIHIAVVDVLGHGVAATKDALAVVHTLRVVIAGGTVLGDAVAQADVLLRNQHPDLVATVLLARYDPQTGALLVASGGHPPALVVTPRREVRQIAASGGVIGWPGAGSDGVTATKLDPGDALILYTDGLVEARKNILDGIDELEQHAAQVADRPAAELASELVARALAGADRRDDTLALVLRRDFVTSPSKRASWTIAPEAAAVRDVRRSFASWLASQNIAPDDVLLAAAELLANAARAARSRVTLHVRLAEGTIVLDVSDDGAAGPDIARHGTTLPPTDAERGRGLFLVRAVSSHVDVLATAEGTTIRANLRAQPAGPAPAPAPPVAEDRVSG